MASLLSGEESKRAGGSIHATTCGLGASAQVLDLTWVRCCQWW